MPEIGGAVVRDLVVPRQQDGGVVTVEPELERLDPLQVVVAVLSSPPIIQIRE